MAGTNNFFSYLFKHKNKPALPYEYDSDNERPVIHASICTGEQVAGFKNKKTGEFHEVMLIRDNDDLAEFKELYGLDKVDKEY